MLKDILLVMASMTIFGDPVTPIQYFGYSIALGGLMYYRLGGEKLKQLGTDTRLAVGGFQRDNPGAVKVLTLVGVLAVIAFVAFAFGSM